MAVVENMIANNNYDKYCSKIIPTGFVGFGLPQAAAYGIRY